MKNVLKDALIKFIVGELMGMAIKAAPFLSFGPLTYILSTLLSKLLNIVLTQTILSISLKLIDVSVDQQVVKMKEAVKKAYLLPADASKEEKDAANKEIILAASHLIDFTH